MSECKVGAPWTPCDGCGHKGAGAYCQRGPVWLCSRCDASVRSAYTTHIDCLDGCAKLRALDAATSEADQRAAEKARADALARIIQGLIAAPSGHDSGAILLRVLPEELAAARAALNAHGGAK